MLYTSGDFTVTQMYYYLRRLPNVTHKLNTLNLSIKNQIKTKIPKSNITSSTLNQPPESREYYFWHCTK